MEELALGRLSMSELELDQMSLRSLINKINGNQARERDEWERVRIMSYFSLMPHIDSKKSLTPQQVLPFPWDNEITHNILDDAQKAAENRRKLWEGIDKEEQNKKE